MFTTSPFRHVYMVFLAFGTLTLVACASSAPTAGIPSSANPREEIATMEQNINDARKANVDVLARKEFRKSTAALHDAKEDLADNKSQEKILNDVRFSKSYLADAYKEAKNEAAKAPGLFEARQAALKAGAAKYSQTSDQFESVDDKVVVISDSLGSATAAQIADLQAQYVELERKAVVQAQLGNAQAKINGAVKDGARRRSPTTLKKAEVAVKNAESVISTNVRNPEGYAAAVTAANQAAELLNEVSKTQNSNGKGLTETAALKMVSQNHQIAGLKTDLNETKSDVADAEAQIDAKERAIAGQKELLAAKNAELSNAEASVSLQKAIEESRSQFTPEEAEAYQQGDNLVIRLKSVNFASGRADLPAQSLPILAKVSEVAKSLHATDIKVEGHTDSLGTSKANKALSESRADAVATYFKSNGFGEIQVESEGMGFEKPIATNKSKEGRAQNRRVDIIITPEGTKTVQ